ncbi:MAG: family 20 glycosylhydrolase [Bacteroidales bacterium]|nr:family 20 glycosylhydrolase [Bacteroidales bacterium]
MKKTSLILAAALALASCAPEGEVLPVQIIPQPNAITVAPGSFDLKGAAISVDDAIDEQSAAAVAAFAAKLSELTATEVQIADKGTVKFVLDPALGPEAYTIKVTPRGVLAKASAFNGFLYAIETLKQMLPVQVYGNSAAPETGWVLPCATISDAPRFAYRGMHLDVARHFFSVEEVKKYLDMMAICKMNRFHWHLTDDQGWRIEIKKYPKLTEFGSIRKQTTIKRGWERGLYDGIPYGEGLYYTQEQAREIVEYAAAKGITVIPEVDLPGHMVAALACYPELGCTGGPYEVWQRWGVSDNLLCAGNEETYVFLENVISELLEIFPSEYFHIGGDECPKNVWAQCPKCQAKIAELGLKDTEDFTKEFYLQSYVTARMEKFLNERGRRLIGWDEILEGDVTPSATIMSWRGTAGGIKAASMGNDAIMTPHTNLYFDYYQSRDVDNEPYGIGGYLPMEKVYAYEPFAPEMDAAARSHILGVQANLWTEYIAEDWHLEYMMLPRAFALSEIQWCQPEVKGWERFLGSLGKAIDRLDIMGYNYAKHVFSLSTQVRTDPETGFPKVTLLTLGGSCIRYTVDGSEPGPDSPAYESPLIIDHSCTVRAIVETDKVESTEWSREFMIHKALGKTVSLNTKPTVAYTFGAPASLVDGIFGIDSYSSGEWSGWVGQPVDLTIDMAGESYSKLGVNCYIYKPDHVFAPVEIKVLASDDNENFTELACESIPVDLPGDPDGKRTYVLSFNQSSAKYLRLQLVTLPALPEWHGAAGSPGFCFIDEVMVD